MLRHASALLAASLLAVAVRAAPGVLTLKLSGSKGEVAIDAVASLIPLDRAPPPPTNERPEIMQEDRQFAPYVTVVQTGTAVVFPNRDTVQHHVYSVSKPKKFELPLYKPGNAEVVTFDEPGVVTLGCNIHDWMVAYLLVVPTPWFGKAAADGAIRLEAPAGRYRLEVWHPRLSAPLAQEVALAEGAPVALEFSLKLKPDRRIRRAPDGQKGGY